MSKRFKQVFPVFNAVHLRYPETAGFGVKLFDIDNIAAYWMQHDKWTFNMEKDFGPIRLPYEWTWMEHGTHRNASQGAGIHEQGWLMHELAAGAPLRARLLRDYSARDLHPDAVLIVASLFIQTPHFDDHVVLSWVTEEGRWITSQCFFPPGSAILKNLPSGLSTADAAAELRSMFNPVALAIGLANCRNVDVPTLNTRDETKKNKRSRNRRPSTEYRVIRLPGAPANRVDGPAQNPGQVRLHTVRGHFKTYTAEKPLYGKFTGTWWWTPNVRGHRRNGEVVSTYQQKAAQP